MSAPWRTATPVFDDEPWMQDAACKGKDTAMFYPSDEKGPNVCDAAIVVCAACPVRDACLGYALNTPPGHDHGVWGGRSERERQKLRKAKNRRKIGAV